jgi:hypothetical protein
MLKFPKNYELSSVARYKQNFVHLGINKYLSAVKKKRKLIDKKINEIQILVKELNSLYYEEDVVLFKPISNKRII